MLNVTDREKNAIPKDMAKRGWRARFTIGERNEERNRSHHDSLSPDVAIMMLRTSSAGGSTSSRLSSQSCPALASANKGPQTSQVLVCDWNSSSFGPFRLPSRASLSRASNSVHCIPLFVSLGITSPAYRYVVIALQVPLDR